MFTTYVSNIRFTWSPYPRIYFTNEEIFSLQLSHQVMGVHTPAHCVFKSQRRINVCFQAERKATSQLVSKRRGRMNATCALYSGSPGFKSRDGKRFSWLRFLRFFSAHEGNAEILPRIRPLRIASCCILTNSLFTNHSIIRPYIIRANDIVVK
jgi:hypothetical protein